MVLVAPEILELDRGQLGISYGVLDRLVAEVVLDRSCVMAGIGKGVAAGVAKHVDVNLEADRGLVTKPLDVAVQGCRRER